MFHIQAIYTLLLLKYLYEADLDVAVYSGLLLQEIMWQITLRCIIAHYRLQLYSTA